MDDDTARVVEKEVQRVINSECSNPELATQKAIEKVKENEPYLREALGKPEVREVIQRSNTPEAMLRVLGNYIKTENDYSGLIEKLIKANLSGARNLDKIKTPEESVNMYKFLRGYVDEMNYEKTLGVDNKPDIVIGAFRKSAKTLQNAANYDCIFEYLEGLRKERVESERAYIEHMNEWERQRTERDNEWERQRTERYKAFWESMSKMFQFRANITNNRNPYLNTQND